VEEDDKNMGSKEQTTVVSKRTDNSSFVTGSDREGLCATSDTDGMDTSVTKADQSEASMDVHQENPPFENPRKL
jgi:hypothetical protein